MQSPRMCLSPLQMMSMRSRSQQKRRQRHSTGTGPQWQPVPSASNLRNQHRTRARTPVSMIIPSFAKEHITERATWRGRRARGQWRASSRVPTNIISPRHTSQGGKAQARTRNCPTRRRPGTPGTGRLNLVLKRNQMKRVRSMGRRCAATSGTPVARRTNEASRRILGR